MSIQTGWEEKGPPALVPQMFPHSQTICVKEFFTLSFGATPNLLPFSALVIPGAVIPSLPSLEFGKQLLGALTAFAGGF